MQPVNVKKQNWNRLPSEGATMDVVEITIRNAQPADVEEIWHLLHNECMAWSAERILSEIATLYILSCGKRLLGVLCGAACRGRLTVSWVTVHPMYPDDSLRLAMIYGLSGALWRQPICAISI